jgi:hypothetical protein
VTGAPHRWAQLHQHILTERERVSGEQADILTSLIRRLKQLADKGHCSRMVVGWFTTETVRGGRKKIALKPGSGLPDNRGRPSIPLRGLEHLEDGALLTLSILLESRGRPILDYSIGIQGTSRKPQRPWYARIDLTEKPEGVGLCGHPLLHCHMGVLADEEVESITPAPGATKTRVLTPRAPLPWLMPHDALDWLLATVDPGLDPT